MRRTVTQESSSQMQLVILALLLVGGVAVTSLAPLNVPPTVEHAAQQSNRVTKVGIFNPFEAVHDPILLVVRVRH